VAEAHVADLLLLPHDGALYAVAREAAEVTPQPANDPSRRIATVRFDPADARRVASGARAEALWAEALDRGALGGAAQALGVADRLIEQSVAYTSERRQFGAPVGSFQAVKHRLADCKVALEYARPVVYRAAVSVATGDPRRGVHVSMARLRACEAATRTARAALQVHGAIGYTWEQDLHLWMRRAWSLERAWGRGDFHHDRIRTALLSGDLAIGPGTTF
jgi:alkylation response protein AidB-like acyl-CoA dehydrogenase